MKKVIVSAALIFIVVMFAGSAFSQPGPDGRMKGKLKEKLNLTDEQESKIDVLKSAHRKEMIDLKAELEKTQVDAKDIREKENISRPEVVASVEKINKLKNEMALKVANHRMDVYEILTPDQRKEWQEFREDHPRMDRMERKGEFREKLRRHMDH